MLVLYMTRVTTAAGSYVTHGFPFELRRIIKTTTTTEYAEYVESVESVESAHRHQFAVTRMRSWVVSARVPHECDVARCTGASRARRAWPRVATALAAYTFLETRLNTDLARLVLVRLVLARYDENGALCQKHERSETIDAMVT